MEAPEGAWAHSPNAAGEWHSLVEHLTRVAMIAREFAEPFGGGDLAYWAGLWHDLGKYHPEWQRYLRESHAARSAGRTRRGSKIDHKGAGSILAASIQCHPVSWLITSHHGGMQDMAEVGNRIVEWRQDQARLDASLQRARASITIDPPQAIASPTWARSSKHALDLFLRLLFSCLVDADSLDTEGHAEPKRPDARAAFPTLAELQPAFEQWMQKLSGANSNDVMRVRDEVYRACLDAAALPPGLFRLTVPTGGGKTLAGLGFALAHALKHQQRRVIVAVPYTSITEQTAGVYRAVFADTPNAVLEHHSAVRATPDEEEPDGELPWTQLAAENWDAPIIVTTTVRLFESLFARSRTDTRRLHRIANSVVIIDEAQTMPTHLLTPLLDMFRLLAEHCGTTIVFCTATQPALDDAPGFSGLPKVREIAPDPPRLFRTLRRVNYEWPCLKGSWSWEQVAAEMRSSPQALAILNTKKDAQALLDAVGKGALHLSTALCGAHRIRVLEEVRQRLRAGESCRLVSTQVVEAGVDLDFPLVLRAFGPLDRIVQAAGRCNREGKLFDGGRLVVFQPEDGGMPRGTYRTATDEAMAMLRNGELDPDDPVTFTRYFRRLYAGVTLDPHKIQTLRQAFSFRKVAEKAKVIEDDGITVVVPYRDPDAPSESDRIKRLVQRLRAMPGPSRGIMRELQPFTVSVHRHYQNEYQQRGLLEELQPGIFQWHSEYDDVRGLVVGTVSPEDWVI